jgi:VWFA-related protein
MNRRAPLLVLLFGATVALAQTPAPQAPQPVFRSGVELVRLDIRAVDADGRPVRDVRADEVEVYEGGARRPVVLFQHVAEPAGTYLEAARRTIGAEVSTNQGSPRAHLYVLVFDQNHITPGNEQRARLAAERFLKTRLRPGDRVALYAIPGPGPQLALSPDIAHAVLELVTVRGSLDRTAFTSAGNMSQYEAYQIVRGDANVLQRVATRAADTPGLIDTHPVVANSLRPADAPTGESAKTINQFVQSNAETVVTQADADSRAFLSALADIIRTLAPIEGRKTVVVFSEGFYSDNLSRDIEQVATAAAQAYAVVQTLDLNRRGPDLTATSPGGGDQAAEIQSRLEPLGTLAADTDGQLTTDAGGQMDRALDHVADVSQDYYVVGFEPGAGALGDRNRYRRVSVKISRPGVTIHARSGYALQDASIARDRRRGIDSVLAAPFPQQGVPLALTTYVMRGTTPGVHRVILSVEADVPVRSGQAARADVVFVTRSARDGRVVASGTDTMALPAAPRAGGTTGLGRFQVQFNAPPGEYLMRVVVREPGGAIGSVDRRFEVAALDGVDVAASDLIVGPKTGALPARATVAVDEGLIGVVEVYARRPGDLDRVEVVAHLGQVGAETALTSVQATLLDVKPLAGGASRAAQIELPLTGIAPGLYVVRATVKAAGETVADLTREVQILPAGARVDGPTAAPQPVRPAQILAGDIGRRLVAALGETTSDRAVGEAVTCGLSGDWPKVETTLRQSSPVYAVRVLRGLALFSADRYLEAADELDGALAPQPPVETAKTRAMTAFLLGWVHAYAARDLEAISAWRNATVLDPALVPAYLALADIYLRRSEPALTEQVLRAGLAAVPESVELKARLAGTGRQQ